MRLTDESILACRLFFHRLTLHTVLDRSGLVWDFSLKKRWWSSIVEWGTPRAAAKDFLGYSPTFPCSSEIRIFTCISLVGFVTTLPRVTNEMRS